MCRVVPIPLFFSCLQGLWDALYFIPDTSSLFLLVLWVLLAVCQFIDLSEKKKNGSLFHWFFSIVLFSMYWFLLSPLFPSFFLPWVKKKFLRFLRLELRLSETVCFLFPKVHFLLSTALVVSHKFQEVVLLFSFSSKYFYCPWDFLSNPWII